MNGIHEVGGSIPPGSTNSAQKPARNPQKNVCLAFGDAPSHSLISGHRPPICEVSLTGAARVGERHRGSERAACNALPDMAKSLLEGL